MPVNKIGSPFQFNYTQEEAPVVKAVEYLINLRPPDIDRALFEDFNGNYAWYCYWVLEGKTQSVTEQDYPLNIPVAKAFKPGGKLMLARLKLCREIMQLVDRMPYSNAWDFWQKVEENWKHKVLQIANLRAKEPNHTKGQTNTRNRQFKQKLLSKENPYQKDRDLHLFTMIDLSLELTDYSSANFSQNFQINCWNPYVKAWKTFLMSQEKGIKLDNGQRAETKTRRFEGKTLVALEGARKKKAIYQSSQKNISGRGRKKSQNNPCATSFSATLPAKFEDNSNLEDTEDIQD